jgi:hypothetical protein
MSQETQISALVSRTTTDLLERHVRTTGVKKGHVVEEAPRHHLRARRNCRRTRSSIRISW